MKNFALIILITVFVGCNNSNMNVEEEFDKALAFMDENNDIEAEKIFLALEAQETELIGVKMNLAVIEERKGDTLKAINYLKSALEMEPNHPVIAQRLAEITNKQNYIELNAELSNKIIVISSEEYYAAYESNLEIVNDDYVKFDLRVTGEITAINKDDKIIYLKGSGTTIEESVVCYKVDKLLEIAKVGEKITILGVSLGKGLDSQNPIIIMKE